MFTFVDPHFMHVRLVASPAIKYLVTRLLTDVARLTYVRIAQNMTTLSQPERDATLAA